MHNLIIYLNEKTPAIAEMQRLEFFLLFLDSDFLLDTKKKWRV